jgi:hypothetical protein
MPPDRPQAVTCEGLIERKASNLPRFIVVPIDVPAVWETTRTITVSGTINGVPLGRRGLKPWGDGRWFIELPEAICQQAGVNTGDRVTLEIAPVEDPIPTALTHRLTTDREFARAWAELRPSQQRQHAEWVASARLPQTRERRAAEVVARVMAEQGG